MGKRRMRKRYEAAFKARVALAALKGDKTLSELARSHAGPSPGFPDARFWEPAAAGAPRLCAEPGGGSKRSALGSGPARGRSCCDAGPGPWQSRLETASRREILLFVSA